MNLAEYIARDDVHLDLRGRDATEVLNELASRLKLDQESEAVVRRILQHRETMGSTGIGRGIGVPHCRTPIAKRLRVTYGRRPGGTPHGAVDGAPVEHFFVLTAPPGAGRSMSGSTRPLRLGGSVRRRLLPVIAALWCASALQAQTNPEAAKRFVGTWRLVSLDVDGQPNPNTGSHPTGRIYYDAAGNMAAQILPDRPRSKWAGALPTPDEARETVIGYIAYFGTYTVDDRERVVSHQRAGALNPNWADAPPLVRRYEFVGDDRLVLIPVDNPRMRLTWERIK